MAKEIKHRWLRKYDTEKRKWTDEVFVWTAKLAGLPNMYEISDEAAKKLQVEKVRRHRMEIAMRNSGMSPEDYKAQSKIAPPEDALPEPEGAAELPAGAPPLDKPQDPDELLRDLEAADAPATVSAVTEEEDDLEMMGKKELLAVIDAEELPVKKTGKVSELIDGIRLCRAEKAKTQTGE
jgi:hypothetical protein